MVYGSDSRDKGSIPAEHADRLSVSEIRKALPEKYRDINIYLYDQIDSTNRAAKGITYDSTLNGTTLIADTQSAGRGRLGRSFVSPAGSGLYMSIILQKDLPREKAVNITTMTAVAVSRAIERLTGMDTQIKWVNDILVGGKKVCGILTEALMDIDIQRINRIVVGIGLNVSTKTESFPEEIRGTAGSLYGNGVSPISRNRFAAEIIAEVLDGADKIETGEYMDEYKKKCFTVGKRVFFEMDGVRYEGEAVRIGDNCELIVRLDGGEEIPVSFGEVSVRTAD
jgi:BirA family biotin operon repressor/biotin-[acetyl-CoA-carboxylase] ligase